jgi:hypothetical protein
MEANMLPRFKVGQRVIIRGDDPSSFAGLVAVVDDVQPNERGISTLDRYVVVFSWGEKQTFYEPQLENVMEESEKKH